MLLQQAGLTVQLVSESALFSDRNKCYASVAPLQ